ncbi:hypothetical protein EDB89DRAFT_1948133, partial [Lactarius sanguifluus]
ASPVPRCAYGDHFWDLRWRKWYDICVAFVVGLPHGLAFPTFVPMAARSPVNSPSHGTSGVLSMAFGRMIGGQVCAVSVTHVTVSL